MLLDAALAELGALRRLHYAIGAEQHNEEVEAAAQQTGAKLARTCTRPLPRAPSHPSP